MCLLAVSPKGSQLDDSMIEAAYHNNSDGFGMFFADGTARGKVIKINPKTFDDVWKVYKQYADKGRNYGLHFRFRTAGKISRHLSHPFLLTHVGQHNSVGTVWLAHNGTISDTPEPATMSDTWGFVKYYMRPILARYPHLLTDPDFLKKLSVMVGYGSKLVMFNATTDEWHIVNKTAGKTLEDGTWVSNEYSLKRGRGFDYTFGGGGGYVPHNSYTPPSVGTTAPHIIPPRPQYRLLANGTHALVQQNSVVSMVLPKRPPDDILLERLLKCDTDVDVYKLFVEDPDGMAEVLTEYVQSIHPSAGA